MSSEAAKGPIAIPLNDKDLKAAALYALVFFREWERGHGMENCNAVALETVETFYPHITATD